MRKTQLILLFLFILLLVACRREQETPTVAATVTPTEAASATPTRPVPTPTLVPTPLPAFDPAAIDWAPQVIYNSPEPGEEALLDGAITIRFDQPMDQASVEAAFNIRTEGDSKDVAGVFEWPRPDTLIFTPSQHLSRQQRYEVTIDPEATGRNGQKLELPINLNFETVGFLEVSQLIPADGLKDISTESSITVMFNRPVVALVTTGQQADLPQPLVIEPTPAGHGEWVSTSIYRFVPDEPLAGATTYQVTVPAGLTDTTGGLLQTDVSWSFTTQSPSVATIIPEMAALDVNPTRPVTITFNMAMDQPTTEGAISLQPAVPLAFTWSEDSRTVTIIPQQRLELSTRYTLTVRETATSSSGQGQLDQETSTIFTTVPYPAVRQVNPTNNSVTEFYQSGLYIEFASPMNPETIEGRIQISPEPEEITYYYDPIESIYFSLNFEFVRNTRYVITIPGDVADPYGNTLGADYSWQFTTPPSQPIVSLNLPFNFSQISTSYPTDVGIIYRNVSTVNVALYDAGLPITILENGYNIYDYFGQTLLRQWSLPVSAGLDVADSLTVSLADGGVLPTGVYLLRLSAPEADPEQTQYWQNQRQMLIVADTNLVVKATPERVHVWATDLATGLAAPGRTLTLYDYSGALIGTATSDANGFATFDYPYQDDYWRGVVVVSNGPGQAGFGVSGSQWTGQLNLWNAGFNYNPGSEEPQFVYLYSDRPIYRPGDTVYFRGILRDADYGRYGLPGRNTVPISVNSLTYYEGENASFSQELTLPTEDNGTFSGQFTLPADVQLGSYQIYVNTGTSIANNYLNFTVAEYRKPQFQVSLTPSQPEILRGEMVDVTVEAKYFFGGAAADLDVNWSAYTTPFTPPWDKSPHYSFSNDQNFFYYYDSFGDSFYGNYLTGGSGKTDSNGQLVISLPADLLDGYENSRQINIEAAVTDLSGLPVSNRTSLVMHAAETYVGLNNDDYIAIAGSETTINLITVDWGGEAVANQEVEVVLYQREYELERDARFGSYFNNWIPIDTEIERLTTTTDDEGLAQANFTPPEGGTYRVVATVTDPAGRTQTSSTFFWATTADFAAWRNNDRDRRMDLIPDKAEYEVGDTARILVQSPFTGPVQAWLTIERGNLLQQQLITLQGNSDVLEIPITADFAPNVFASVVVVKGIDETNAYADIRLGIIELPVKPNQLQLNVSLLPRQTAFAPGDVAIYDIEVTDYAGNPVSADLSLALVDLAVLTLQPDNSPEIGTAFYSRQPFRTFIGSGLFVSGEGLDIEVPLEQLGYGGGGGGGDSGLRSAALEEEDDVRRDFPDTAFWQASLVTDESGRATVEIPLPDSLTTWRLSSKAVTPDSLVGQTSVDVVVSLPLLLRPVTPRFFTVGDVAYLGAIVNNNTPNSIEATVSLEADGLTLADDPEQVVTVPAGGQQLVRWQVTVQDVANVNLTFRVNGGGFSDATKPSFGVGPDQLIPVYRYDAQDFVGTSGVVESPGRSVEAVLLPPVIDLNQGSVDITLSPSLAAAMLETLDYLDNLTYDTNCAHAIAHQLLPNVAAARAFSELNLNNPIQGQLDQLITDGISRLAALQKMSGGWGWCYSEQSDPYLTAYVLFSLAKAEQAGYDVSGIDIATAIRTQLIITINRVSSTYLANRMAWFLYVRGEWGQADLEDIDQLFSDHRELLDPYSQAFLAMAYDLSGGSGSPNQQTLLATLGSSAILSGTGAHWEDSIQDYANFNSDVRGTAIVLDALARLDPESGLAPQAVRWLMVNRTGSHWYSDYETTWSVLALTDWMVATGELNADFGYQLNINGVEALNGTFDQNSLLTPVQFSQPLNQLLANEANFLDIQHLAGDGRLYYTAHLNSWLPVDSVQAVSRGITVQRTYYDAACESDCQPISQIASGQQVRVALSIVAINDLSYVLIEDAIPAGAEAVDPTLDTAAYGFDPNIENQNNDYFYGYWGWWFFDRIEYRDEKVVFYSGHLPAGAYQYTYYLQAYLPGTFQVMPTIAREEFFPEVFGRSNGFIFTVTE